MERRNKKLKEYYFWFDIVRNDIDEAIRVSKTYDEFTDYLEDEYYEVRDAEKNLTVTPYGRRAQGQGRIRTSRLGTGYAKEEIIERINNRVPYLNDVTDGKREVTYGNKNRVWHSIRKKKKRKPKWLMTKFERKVYYWWASSYYLLAPKKIKMTPEQRALQLLSRWVRLRPSNEIIHTSLLW